MTKQTPISAAAQALYRSVFGAPPNDIVALNDDLALVETGEFGSDACPSGYKEILIRRSPMGWRVYAVIGRSRSADALQTAADMRSQLRRPLQT